MSLTLTEKLIHGHHAAGTLEPGSEIGIRIDQVLTQDATGTLVYMHLEALELRQAAPDLAVSYVDHNTLQTGPESADDHRYLAEAAHRFGSVFSGPGQGICHQVHLENYGRPGLTLVGSDSHTPTAGALGMLAIGAGGLSVTAVLAGEPLYLDMPRVMQVELLGRLPQWVGGKDVVLELLRRLGVQGGRGFVLEYTGSGIATLPLAARATVCNMGVETGSTSSVFPSDDVTRSFLRQQGRESDWMPLAADEAATYPVTEKIDLDLLEPLVALPHSPDRVVPVREAGNIPVTQVIVGSCTNSAFADLSLVDAILAGRQVHPGVELVVAPGSRQVVEDLVATGAWSRLSRAGARLLEPACGPCIGMGQVPPSHTASLRTFNRNFRGRCGNPSAGVYLCGPQVAAATALKGYLADPRTLGPAPCPGAEPPGCLEVRTEAPAAGQAAPTRGPHMAPIPLSPEPPDQLSARVLLQAGDDVSTDDILPGGNQVLPLRANVPALAAFCFRPLDDQVPHRAASMKNSVIVAGHNYGQGSSREHAALVPSYLGVRAVIARSFARIHRSNLINYGIAPLLSAGIEHPLDLPAGTEITFPHWRRELENSQAVTASVPGGPDLSLDLVLSPRERSILLRGGLLPFLRHKIREVSEPCTE